MRGHRRGALVALAALLVALAAVGWLNLRDEDPIAVALDEPAATPEQRSRGAYLARAGNCSACHPDRGGSPYAGGKGIPTPFGTVYASNLTPDRKTGIGSWSAAHFWRAMHNGRSKDGRLLYPAFPYPSFTLITREDSDALYAFLRSQPPVQQPNRPLDDLTISPESRTDLTPRERRAPSTVRDGSCSRRRCRVTGGEIRGGRECRARSGRSPRARPRSR